MTKSEKTRSGFISIIGETNVGKSTFLNQVIGSKVSIVSPKVQTTRMQILGILIRNKTQIIFIDTPGIFSPKRRLDRAMIASAWVGAEHSDEVLLLLDTIYGINDFTREVINKLMKKRKKITVALNKIDRVKKEKLLGITKELIQLGDFEKIFSISALTGDGIEELLDYLASRITFSPWLYPKDQISNIPERTRAAEITREQLYFQLHQEIPYEATVETECWKIKKDGSVHINQTIIVERPNQKAIVLGKNGKRIKKLGEISRRQLEYFFQKKIHLFLFVKVEKNWSG